jgi:hypothetical protein
VSGLDPCASKRGFFTLRDCTNAATTTCGICSRRVCDEHLAPRVDAKVCVECAARQAEEGTAQPAAPGQPGMEPALGPTLERLDPTTLAVGRRFRYYRSYDYSPMWWGSYDPWWNDYDTRWYGGNDDDDDAGGFGDS